jgi:secreted trypsin-like serine protease
MWSNVGMVRNAASILLTGAIATVLATGDAPATARSEPRLGRVVVGGVIAPVGRFPWMVRLSMGCGGALIGVDVVLTAGHCVDGTGPNTTIKVVAGVVDLRSEKALTAQSVEVIRASGFHDETRGDDWAVIKLDRPLGLPVLPLTAEAGDRGKLMVMGWGQIRESSMRQVSRLHYAIVPTVPDAKCAADYAKAGVRLVTTESICAGRVGVDTCLGDSGGPMVGKDARGRWVQVGITSWGLGCARPGYPGVYTQISIFRTAIGRAIRKLS